MTIVGMIMISKTPTNLGNEVTLVGCAKANPPTEPAMPKITKVVAFARLLVDTPPLRIPADKNTNPINIVSPESACIPVRKVFAIPR